jgi:hypothetical protein
MARLWWDVSLIDLSLNEPLEEIDGSKQEKMGGEFRVVDNNATCEIKVESTENS